MSGAGEVGQGGNSPATDIDALMAANEVAPATTQYEVTDGGFADPEAGQQAQEPATVPEPTPAPTPEPETQILGQPDQPTEPEPEPEPTPEAEVPSGPSQDEVYQGLLSAAQAERQARQAIQQQMAEQQRLLQEAQGFREQYEPHIQELSELWPQIQQQSSELEEAQRQHAALNKRLELYRAAAQEAGVEVDESSFLAQERLEMLERRLAELPNQLDTRLSRLLDSRTQDFDQRERERERYEYEQKIRAEHQQAVASKLDSFYEANPAMRDFDTFIRQEVTKDPTVDPNVVAAPFMKAFAQRTVAARAAQRGAVSPGSTTVAQTAPAEAEASAQRSLSEEYAGMGIDAQIAKLKRSGLIR
jgi:hypothetical protein